MEIRNVQVGDAAAVLTMQLQLDQETKNMMLEPGERPTSPEVTAHSIARTQASGSLWLVAAEGPAIVGFLAADRGEYHRIRHSAYIVTGILAAYRGQGIGTQFFQQLDVWAKANSVSRLELTVRVQNDGAIRLYQKSGFEIEGIKRNSLLVDGVAR